jgi:hypothetical protein
MAAFESLGPVFAALSAGFRMFGRNRNAVGIIHVEAFLWLPPTAMDILRRHMGFRSPSFPGRLTLSAPLVFFHDLCRSKRKPAEAVNRQLPEIGFSPAVHLRNTIRTLLTLNLKHQPKTAVDCSFSRMPE